jgi:hypothetical protein
MSVIENHCDDVDDVKIMIMMILMSPLTHLRFFCIQLFEPTKNPACIKLAINLSPKQGGKDGKDGGKK